MKKQIVKTAEQLSNRTIEQSNNRTRVVPFVILYFLFASVFYPLESAFSQSIAINTTGAAANASALLDVDAGVAANKGMLIPRVALTGTDDITTVSNAPYITSLLVYNTATAGSGSTAVYPGYYYWNGTKWVSFGGSGGTDWSLTGNAGTTAGTNFIGTTDAQDLVFNTGGETSAFERMRILSTGNVGIGTTAPGAKLDIAGNIKITDGTQGAGKVLTSDAAGLATWQTGGGTPPPIAPIGSVISWLKSFPNTPALPAGWVECSGQVLSDGASPYNGQTIPNLNGNNYFMRGNTASGGTGGSITHTHTFGQTATDLAPDASNVSNGSFTNPANHLPPYYDVVWIMRVK